MFILFSNLPVELRNHIWALAANNEPRIIDVWNKFDGRLAHDCTFYISHYHIMHAAIAPPSLLAVSRESRSIALEHYVLEYRTAMRIDEFVEVIQAKVYINYATDTLVPRGFWNMVSFEDFVGRCYGRLHTLAIDINQRFWHDNLKDYVVAGKWILDGVKEVFLYDTRGGERWKGSENLHRYTEVERPERMDLSFKEVGGGSEALKEVREMILRTLDIAEGKFAMEVEEGIGKKKMRLKWYDNVKKTRQGKYVRPEVKIMELVTSIPEGTVMMPPRHWDD